MRKYLVAGATGLGLLTLGIPAAQAGTGGEQPPAGVVSATPVTNTPHLATTTSTTEQIRQLVQCGGNMYAVGTFSTIRKGSSSFARTDIFSFSASAPYTVTSWAPKVVGSTNTGRDRYGRDQLHRLRERQMLGRLHRRPLHVRSTAPACPTSPRSAPAPATSSAAFAHSANGGVNTLAAVEGAPAGGRQLHADQRRQHPVHGQPEPATGKSDGFLNLSIKGSQVYNQQVSHGGNLDLVEGVFSSVGGVTRHQMFMLNVGGTRATVTGWYSPDFNGAASSRSGPARRPGRRMTRPSTWHDRLSPAGGSNQRTADRDCDVALAYPATQASVAHRWINYTGCDSLYSVAADTRAAYFGGHERYSMNQQACDTLGPARLQRPWHRGPGPRQRAPATSTRPVRRGTTAGPGAWAPTTCWSPAPGCGSPATTSTAATPAAASAGWPASASCRTPSRDWCQGSSAAIIARCDRSAG